MRLRLLFCFLLLQTTTAVKAQPFEDAATPAFVRVPELSSAFRQLYIQRFPEGRALFEAWESQHPDEPFGQVAIAASYLFEEFYRQGVLTSDFFLNEKKFLHGIDGDPDPVLMESFETAIQKARALATERLSKDPRDPEALYALTLSAGMESDADMILRKHNLEALHRLKEANVHAKALLAERADAKDAYLALGSANYIIGSLSVGFRAMLWFGGVHGDRKLGMRQLEEAAYGGRYLEALAKIMLALAARREKQKPLAQKLLRELTEEFPESPLYAAEYAKVMGRPIPASMHP
jgi:hypothetical protein